MIQHDSYYKDQSHISFEERVKTNYDHPLAFDTDFMIQQLKELLAGRPVDIPIYDYKEHTRSNRTFRQEPQDVIIVEGILVLEDERLRELMDIKLLLIQMMTFGLSVVFSVIWLSVAEALRALLSSTQALSSRCIINLLSQVSAMLILSFQKGLAMWLLLISSTQRLPAS